MNNILNKIAQMERNAEEIQLATHKVELTLADDVRALYNNANKFYEANIDERYKMATRLEKEFQKAADEYQKALDKYNSLEKMSKDLGVPIPNEISKLKDLIEYGLKDSLKSKSNAANILAI